MKRKAPPLNIDGHFFHSQATMPRPWKYCESGMCIEHFAGKTNEEGISDDGKLPSNNEAKEHWII